MSDKVTIDNVIVGLIAIFAVYNVGYGVIMMNKAQVKGWRIAVITLLTVSTWAWILLPCGGFKALGIKDCPSTTVTVTGAILSFIATIVVKFIFYNAEKREGNPYFQFY
jgi:hypothetical protein